ncbi:MAG: MucB/RseB C-terminal domain-containing protein [Rubrivivax sp.]|nr:MucB/RseB C-terminal domain-containing protein [Rubrivivax sp.]
MASAQAPDAAPAGNGPLSAVDGRAWLTRIDTAARTANYQGTLVYSAAGVLSSSRVWHYLVADQTYERLEALDGRHQRIVRHNELVHTFWPQTKVAVVERRETLAAWSTTPLAVDPQALEHYALRREGSARVAGRDAAVLLLEPRDLLRYAQRLWADEASGLMLRADVIGDTATGARVVLESTAFSEVDIGVRPQPEQALQWLRKLDGYRVLRPQQSRTTLEAEGWAMVRPVSGFRLAGCMRRGMAAAGDEAAVLQAVFSDGLMHVSVFVEPFEPQHQKSDVLAQQGATATLMTRRGDYRITAVGDVPPPTLRQFVDAIERRRP